MPSQPYNLVKDEPDLRVPLHTDEEFYSGITFQAKVSKKIVSVPKR
jgi:carboxyl-terminal PDZ ligand of neuronal nitric oxide synthase protein